MGIHGLTSFIDNNSHLLKDHQLHDCRVVIDGNNLYHFLYFYCNVRFQFGGDYDVFQKKICMIFSIFKSCNVEVIVVFDGAYTVNGRKHKTIVSRARDKVFAAQRIVNGHRGNLIPCLAQLTFRQTLDKLGIQHVTCDFEADNQLVTLANQWNCPVISNDSDFYIFELTGGFIPLDYIDFRPCQMPIDAVQHGHACAFLPVQYYHVDGFIKCFRSLNRSVLPLFATMLGNDYVDGAAFEAFYQKTPKIASKRYSASKKHQKIVSALYWLEEKDHKNKEELVSEVLTFIRSERRQQVEKLLTDSINGYTDTEHFESFNLKAFLEGDRSAASQKTDLVTTLRGKRLPAWFVAACRCGDMPAFLLNAALVHCVMLQTQVESVSLPAAFVTSRHIREVIYGMLLGQEHSNSQSAIPVDTQPWQEVLGQGLTPDSTTAKNQGDSNPDFHKQGDDTCQTQVQSKQAADTENSVNCESKTNDVTGQKTELGVVEYTRHKMELWRIMVEPCYSLPVFGNIPSLEDIPSLSVHDRSIILMDTLGMTSQYVERFDPALQLYMMCLLFWVRNSDPAISLHHLKAVVLSAFLLHVHKEIFDRENQMIEDCVKENGGETHDNHCQEYGQDSKTNVLSTKAGAQSAFHEHSETLCSLPDISSKSLQATEEKGNCNCSLGITSACQSEDSKVLEKVRDNLKKYYHDPAKIGSKNPPDLEIFHGSAQFQACLLDVVHLNYLLQCPLPKPQLATLFNGSFVYTFTHELRIRSNPDRFLSEMLVKGSALTKVFSSLCAEIINEAGEGMFAEQKSQGKKCCKSTKKKKKAGRAGPHSQPAVHDDSASVVGVSVQDTVATCDLNNRFGVLMLEDDS